MRNAGLIVAAVVVLVLGFVLARDTSEEQDDAPTVAQTTPATTTVTAPTAAPPDTTSAPAPRAVPEIEIEDGEPVGGVQELEFEKGDTIRFTVRSDVVDHVHVHGFDVMKDVAPGKVASFSIPAKFDGRFEVELEDRGVEIAELRVQP